MKFFLCKWLHSVPWRCWLGDRKGIRPVKTECLCAGMVICLERDADLHMAQLMPLPLTVSCFSKIQIGFTFLVPAHPGSPGKGAVKRVCVCKMVKTAYFPLTERKFRNTGPYFCTCPCFMISQFKNKFSSVISWWPDLKFFDLFLQLRHKTLFALELRV